MCLTRKYFPFSKNGEVSHKILGKNPKAAKKASLFCACRWICLQGSLIIHRNSIKILHRTQGSITLSSSMCYPSPWGVSWGCCSDTVQYSISQTHGICPLDVRFQCYKQKQCESHTKWCEINQILTVQGPKNPTSVHGGDGGVPLKIRSCCFPPWQGREFPG